MPDSRAGSHGAAYDAGQGGLSTEVAEDATRTLWCPFARALNWQAKSSGAVNRVHTNSDERREGGPDPDCMCMGRRCMAWVPTGFGVGSCGLVRQRERIGIAPQTPADRHVEEANHA